MHAGRLKKVIKIILYKCLSELPNVNSVVWKLKKGQTHWHSRGNNFYVALLCLQRTARIERYSDGPRDTARVSWSSDLAGDLGGDVWLSENAKLSQLLLAVARSWAAPARAASIIVQIMPPPPLSQTWRQAGPIILSFTSVEGPPPRGNGWVVEWRVVEKKSPLFSHSTADVVSWKDRRRFSRETDKN